MATDARQRGQAGEDAACAHLQAAGLQLLARNFHVRGGELDLVMDDAGCVVFVEVRQRSGTAFGGGAASIDVRKCRRLVLAAELFLVAHPRLSQRPCRFDVVELQGRDAPTLRWIRDAFRADDC